MVTTGQLDVKNTMGGRKACTLRRTGAQETPLFPTNPQGDGNEDSLALSNGLYSVSTESKLN